MGILFRVLSDLKVKFETIFLIFEIEISVRLVTHDSHKGIIVCFIAVVKEDLLSIWEFNPTFSTVEYLE
jgi:hypothetical protein